MMAISGLLWTAKMHNKSLLDLFTEKQSPNVPIILPDLNRCVVGVISENLAVRLRNCIRLDDNDKLLFDIGALVLGHDQVSGCLRLTL